MAWLHRFAAVVLGVVWAVASPARAADLSRPLSGARTLAMGGAHRGLGSSNETLVLNPAGLALSRRYSIDLQYNYGAADRLQHLNASVVDSKSSGVAAGLGYTRDWGNPSGVDPKLNRVHAAAAYNLGAGLATGATLTSVYGDYHEAGGRHAVSAYGSTIGLGANIGGMLGLGAVWHNMLSTGTTRLLPPSLGFGASLHWRLLTVAADAVVDMSKEVRRSVAYHAGAELFLLDVVALRGGWSLLPRAAAGTQQAVSFGLGLINEVMGLNVSAERQLRAAPQWTVLGSVQLFL